MDGTLAGSLAPTGSTTSDVVLLYVVPLCHVDGACARMANKIGPKQDVMRTLRETCGIPATSYFLAVTLDDGRDTVFAGPGRLPSGAIESFFDQSRFLDISRRMIEGTSLVLPRAPSTTTVPPTHTTPHHPGVRH